MKRFVILCALVLSLTVQAWALDAQQPAPPAQAPAQETQTPAVTPSAPAPAEAAAPSTQPKIEVVKPEDLAKVEKKAEPAKPAEKIETTPGVVVYARPFPASGNMLSEADYGAFSSTKYVWDVQELSAKGIKVGENPFVLEIQALLVVKEPGLYQFALDSNVDFTKWGGDKNYLCLINLEGSALTTERKEANAQTKENRSVGAAKLTPGVYNLQIVGGYSAPIRWAKMAYSLLMKGPNDLSFRTPKTDELVIKK